MKPSKSKHRLDPEVYRAAALLLCQITEDEGGWFWRHIGCCSAIHSSSRLLGHYSYGPYIDVFWAIFNPDKKDFFWWSSSRMDEDARCARCIALELAALIAEKQNEAEVVFLMENK